jgi:dUTP pyrophosphatase
MKIEVKLMAGAKMPERKTEFAAGYDLHARGEAMLVLPSGAFMGIHTGVNIAIPLGYYGRIAPRSGLAFSRGIDVLGGVIDSDYRGELIVILKNSGWGDFIVSPGDRIAQLIIEKCYEAEFEVVSELPPTQRGEGGLGSTGR